MRMTAIAESHRRQEPENRGLYLTDIGLLNEIYQAAKALLIQQDKFALAKLARAIHQAEWGAE